jgi:hypothetical protein
MKDSLYKSPTQISNNYRMLAQKIVDLCPVNLATEVALTGSAARGLADEDSDIELNLWAKEIPAPYQRQQWLEKIGAINVTIDAEPIADGSVWTTCQFENTWVEIGWQTEIAQETLLQSILQAEITDTSRLIVAGLINQAIVLRSNGLLSNWQNKLKYYPEDLQTKLILEAIDLWQFPHIVALRWALVRRNQHFALMQRLAQDINNLLRILFALNKQWEMDCKWLEYTLAQLPTKPPKTVERINAIFSSLSPIERVKISFSLIIETLELLPQLPSVKLAITTLQESFDRAKNYL